MLKTVEIKNYKSIKDLHLDCKRINLFIGKPNVGKSNILEAISLLQDGIGAHIRKEDMRNLFFDQDIEDEIKIESDKMKVRLGYIVRNNFFIYTDRSGEFYEILKDQENLKLYKPNGSRLNNYMEEPLIKKNQIKPYLFKKENLKSLPDENGNMLSLSYPHGKNLFSVLKNNKSVLKEIGVLFKEYGYDLVIDFVSDQAEIQKSVDGVMYKIPYSLIADTLQRAIFHYCAIATNEGNVLLLEEPENNSFPPYIRKLALDIIDSTTNQFFIATHSPYLLNTIISEAPKEEVAINIVSFDNFQTKIHTLTQEEISKISDYGIDVFFNLDLFES